MICDLCNCNHETFYMIHNKALCVRCYYNFGLKIRKVALSDVKLPYGTSGSIRELVRVVKIIYAKKTEPQDHSVHSA